MTLNLKSCINGYLKNKTRVLVTHQVHHLESADQIFVLRNVSKSCWNNTSNKIKDNWIRFFGILKGNMVAKGTYNELLKTELALLTTMEAEEVREADEVDDRTGEESIVKEAEAISKEMKAREEVLGSLLSSKFKCTTKINNIYFYQLRSSKKNERKRIK